jgi:L-ascorbate metabolism protein UlaG (beta-lactamase superfamily)
MQIRWLGWAGVEIAAQGQRVVIDPLADPLAVFAWLGERGHAVPLPDVVVPQPGAIAGLLTHLHRDHADAAALAAALAPGKSVYEPLDYGGQGVERLALLQADQELAAGELARQPTGAWTSITAGPFTLTALPAVDGTGDPQVSWLIEADGKRVLHLGDTVWHGWWWRIAERYGAPDVLLAPINGPRVNFPHRQPASHLPAAMDPEQPALAAQLLRADRLVPIHYGGYELPGVYEPVVDPLERAGAASDRATPMKPGETIEI